MHDIYIYIYIYMCVCVCVCVCVCGYGGQPGERIKSSSYGEKFISIVLLGDLIYSLCFSVMMWTNQIFSSQRVPKTAVAGALCELGRSMHAHVHSITSRRK